MGVTSRVLAEALDLVAAKFQPGLLLDKSQGGGAGLGHGEKKETAKLGSGRHQLEVQHKSS